MRDSAFEFLVKILQQGSFAKGTCFMGEYLNTGEVLGRGSFAEVHRGLYRNKTTGRVEQVAIKQVQTANKVLQIQREVDLMKQLNRQMSELHHPNIVVQNLKDFFFKKKF